MSVSLDKGHRGGWVKSADLKFPVGLSGVLYCAYGAKDGGDDPAAWEQLEKVAVVPPQATSVRCDFPWASGEREGFARFFLFERQLEPSGTLYDYIEFDGRSCIDLEFKPSASMTIEMRVSLAAVAESSCLFCARQMSGDPARIGLFYVSGGGWRFDYGANGSCVSSAVAGVPYGIVADGTGLYLNDVRVSARLPKTFSGENPLTLFAAREGDSRTYKTKGRLYSCRIWSADRRLLLDLVPSVTNGMPCLRDATSGVCIGNHGTGMLTCGPEKAGAEILCQSETLKGLFGAGPYVPKPHPVKSLVEITALYYPGTEHMPEWDVIAQTCPERKPLLGWYDEGNPEAIDWQIKWAVEHGISSFCVDWYWNRGSRRLEHWVKGFYRAKYRRYLKWFMMYANHNQPGSHSTEDQISVTRYWLDNYFRTPEYYTIDGKPAVVVWDWWRIDSDFIAEAAEKGEKLNAGEGIRRAFSITDRMVKEAGLPGVYWIVMNTTKQYTDDSAAWLKGLGFRMGMTYNFCTFAHELAPQAMKPDEKWYNHSFDVSVSAVWDYWKNMATHDDFPFWVPLPTGWDDRPRSFSKSRRITGRTPEKFAEVCRRARRFCDEHGRRHVLVLPINEWQEGSYIEPNAEYGFGMYDALRDAFCEKPAGGWPKNMTPEDLGMGPYDFPPMYFSPVQAWSFDQTTEGWYRQPYGGGEVENHDGCLTFVVNWMYNFNIRQRLVPFEAAKYEKFRVCMKIIPNKREGLGESKDPQMRLKWGTKAVPIIGPGLVINQERHIAACPAICDGQWHEYTLDLRGNRDWTGEVNELWFEAASVRHARVAIDWMRFE